MRENMPLNSSGEGSKRYHKSFPKACNGGFFTIANGSICSNGSQYSVSATKGCKKFTCP